MNSTPDPADESANPTEDTTSIALDRLDENRQAGLLTMEALSRLGLELPTNEPVLRERTPGGEEYVVVVALGPAIGSGGAKVACMMWGVEEDPEDPITFGIDDRETDTWVEGFPAAALNRWVDPDADAEYETYPVERVDDDRFRLVASTDFFDAYEQAGGDGDASTDGESTGAAEAPGTALDPGDDPTFY